MIGALVGWENLPDLGKNRILKFDCTTQGRVRPEFLSIKRYAMLNIDSLIKCRP